MGPRRRTLTDLPFGTAIAHQEDGQAMRLQDKVALVTGAGRGIGRAIALCLADEGADVAVNSLDEDVKRVADEIKVQGRKSLALVADVTDERQVNGIVQAMLDAFGRIDILVNNVGGHGPTHYQRTDEAFVHQSIAEWDEAFAINLRSAVMMCAAVAPHFIAQTSGKVLNVSSVAGVRAAPRNMAYGASKAGVISFTKTLAEELGEHGINVNCVCPGRIDTALYEEDEAQFVRLNPEAGGETPKQRLRAYQQAQFIKREVSAEDVGRAVAFLVSDDARSITGQTLTVNGGSRVD